MRDVEAKIFEVVRLGLLLNPMPTQREKTMDKPTVFINFLGHVALLQISIHSNGWDTRSPYCSPDLEWEIHLEENEEIVKRQLDEAINHLTYLFECWEG